MWHGVAAVLLASASLIVSGCCGAEFFGGAGTEVRVENVSTAAAEVEVVALSATGKELERRTFSVAAGTTTDSTRIYCGNEPLELQATAGDRHVAQVFENPQGKIITLRLTSSNLTFDRVYSV